MFFFSISNALAKFDLAIKSLTTFVPKIIVKFDKQKVKNPTQKTGVIMYPTPSLMIWNIDGGLFFEAKILSFIERFTPHRFGK